MKNPPKLKNKLCYSVRVFLGIQAGKGQTGEQFFLLGPCGNQGWVKRSVGSSEFLSPLLALYTQATNFTPLMQARFYKPGAGCREEKCPVCEQALGHTEVGIFILDGFKDHPDHAVRDSVFALCGG